MTIPIRRVGPDGLTTNFFGPFVVPAGASHATRFTGWPAPTLRSEIDLNRDGIPEVITFITPGTGTTPPAPAMTAQLTERGLLVSWPASSVGWRIEQTFEIGGESATWTTVAIEPAESNGTVQVLLPTSAAHAFLRLRRVE